MTPEEILAFLSEQYGADVETITSKHTHKHNDCNKRIKQLAMYVVYHGAIISLEETGKIFGGRDHATVKSAIERIDDKIYPGIEEEARALLKEIRDVRRVFLIKQKATRKIEIKYCDNATLFGMFKMSVV